MHVRFWGTRGSIPTPGQRTVGYGGNTSCVEVRASDGTLIIFDCGSGIRELGLNLLRSNSRILRVYLLIGHTHWDHIQGFPFFTPAFFPGAELNIFAPAGFQRSLEDSLSGQMQHAYFPVKLNDLASQIHFTELEEGFFRIGEVLVETQYINHTAPTIAYRLSDSSSSIAYVTDHEPFSQTPVSPFKHPGDQRHAEFLRHADLLIHDAQYSAEEYKTKLGWGHSTAEYATDVALAAKVGRLALFHHDPAHDDAMVRSMEDSARARAAAAGSPLEVFAAAEGMEFDVAGSGRYTSVVQVSALESRRIPGSRVLIVSDRQADVIAAEHALAEDGLVLTPAPDGKSALQVAAALIPDMVIMDANLSDGSGASFIQPLRKSLNNPDLPVLLLIDDDDNRETLYSAEFTSTDYLSKPYSPPMLRTRVRAWLARSLGGRPQVVGDTDGEVSRERMQAEHIQNYADSIATLPLFRTLHRAGLEQLTAAGKVVNFSSGDLIIRQGELGRCVFVILSGRVRIVEALPDSPVEMFLGELGHGEVLGELGVLRGRPRSATVVAIGTTRCLEIPAADFTAALRGSPDMSMELLRVLAGRLYEADRLIARYAPDPLTGLPGRRAFHDMYQRLAAVARRRKTGLLVLALDVVHLKDINDRFGHSVGDDVLRTVGGVLTDSSRSTDVVARYGADEFATLLLEAGESDVRIIVQRVQEKLQEMAVRRGLPMEVQCSIGFAVTDNPPETIDELLRAADQDMQTAKRRQLALLAHG